MPDQFGWDNNFGNSRLPQRLTAGQRQVLEAAASPGGVSKANTSSRVWANFDQLERRGLIVRRGASYFTASLPAAMRKS